MPEPEKDQDRIIVESLRETFTPLTSRLMPEMEPATIYSPRIQFSDMADEEAE
jgi:hypothetical protein